MSISLFHTPFIHHFKDAPVPDYTNQTPQPHHTLHFSRYQTWSPISCSYNLPRYNYQLKSNIFQPLILRNNDRYLLVVISTLPIKLNTYVPLTNYHIIIHLKIFTICLLLVDYIVIFINIFSLFQVLYRIFFSNLIATIES